MLRVCYATIAVERYRHNFKKSKAHSQNILVDFCMFPLFTLHMHENYCYFSSIKCDKQGLSRARHLDMNVSLSYVWQRVSRRNKMILHACVRSVKQ